MSNNTSIKIYTKYFDYALIAFSMFYCIRKSLLDFTWMHTLASIMLLLSCGLSLLSILCNYKWSIINIIAFLLLFCIPLYLKVAYNSDVFVSTMLVLAAYNIPFSHIAKICSKTIIAIIAIVLFSLFVGIIDDNVHYRDVDIYQDGYAHDLGFKYYSVYAVLGMGWMQSIIYLWKQRISLMRVLFLIALACLIFFLSSTRTQFYAYIIFITTIFINKYVPKKILYNKLFVVVAIILYPIICIVQYFVSKYQILSLFYDDFKELDNTFNGRLHLNEEAFIRYDVTFWGNNLEFETNRLTLKEYFYIDSGYMQSLLGDGLIFISIILIMYCVLTYKIIKAKAYYLYIWIVLYAFLNTTSTLFVNLFANPMLFLVFSDIETIRDDYYSEKSSVRRRIYN